MAEGIISKKLERDGYGFIHSAEVGSVFFHVNDIGANLFNELVQGDAVSFEYQEANKGKRATSMIKKSLDAENTDKYVITFSEQQIRDLFGELAAEEDDEDRFNAYFIKTDVYEKIHNFLPIRVLVAHKGIGKSAIFRMSHLENQRNNILSLWVKPDDISSLGKVDGEIDPLELIRQWKSGLEELLVDKIITNFSLNSTNDGINQFASKGVRMVDRISSIIRKVSETVDVDKIKKGIAEQYIKDNRIVVYIDDLDRAWDGSKKNIARLSALLNAIRDMCAESSEICFRISLRSDVYYLVRTADESTDKIDGNVLWLKWTEHELLVLLVKRVQSYLGNELSESNLLNMKQHRLSEYLNDIMESNFKGSGKWNERPIRYILLSLIRRRPRDLVNLCTLAARNANANKRCLIGTDDWEEIFEQYSTSRLQDTINEHRYELPDVERLLLGMKPSHEIKKTQKPFVYDTDAISRKVDGIMQKGVFLFSNGKEANCEDLIAFMYKINFLCARKSMKDGFIDRKYFEENKYITSGYVDFGYDWEVHPAFRWALYPESRDILAVTDITEFSQK